jgi:cardiolipin synthase
LADGETAVVGTVNLDYRSLYLHFENAVWMYKSDCLTAIRADFETTFPLCRKVEREAVRKTPFLVRLSVQS